VIGQRTAYAYTNEVTTDSLLELAEVVRQAATENAHQTDINLCKKNARVDLPVRRDPDHVDTSQKTGMVLQANKAARGSIDASDRLVTYRENRQHVIIASSDGFIAEDERMYLTALVHVVVSRGDVVQTDTKRSAASQAGNSLMQALSRR